MRATPLAAAKVGGLKSDRCGTGGRIHSLVRDTGAALWLIRCQDQGGRKREMGLGPARGDKAVSLADARDRAAGLRLVVRGALPAPWWSAWPTPALARGMALSRHPDRICFRRLAIGSPGRGGR